MQKKHNLVPYRIPPLQKPRDPQIDWQRCYLHSLESQFSVQLPEVSTLSVPGGCTSSTARQRCKWSLFKSMWNLGPNYAGGALWSRCMFILVDWVVLGLCWNNVLLWSSRNVLSASELHGLSSPVMKVKWQWLNFNLYTSFPDPDPDHVFMKRWLKFREREDKCYV